MIEDILSLVRSIYIRALDKKFRDTLYNKIFAERGDPKASCFID